MPNFYGRLNSNEIFAAIFNMIISQEIFADNIEGTYSDLVDEARVDGGLFGDSKLYYSTDVLNSLKWGNDREANDLLAIFRPEDPKCQKIVLDQFRQISLTVDFYLSKRAWSTEGAFASFAAVMLGWIRNTKRCYDSTTYNAFVGTEKSESNRSVITVDIASVIGQETGEAKNRLEAQAIATAIADLIVDLKDITRDFNDYQQLRSLKKESLVFVWNSKFVNRITKLDIPSLFHKEGLIDQFGEKILPWRFFGDKGEVDIAKAENDGTYRAMSEDYYAQNEGDKPVHVFGGDLIPKGTAKVTEFTGYGRNMRAKTLSDGIAAGDYYVVDENRIGFIMARGAKSVPFMSAFEVATSFFNAKSLTENHYLTWGHNTLEHIKGRPFIRLEAKYDNKLPSKQLKK